MSHMKFYINALPGNTSGTEISTLTIKNLIAYGDTVNNGVIIPIAIRMATGFRCLQFSAMPINSSGMSCRISRTICQRVEDIPSKIYFAYSGENVTYNVELNSSRNVVIFLYFSCSNNMGINLKDILRFSYVEEVV